MAITMDAEFEGFNINDSISIHSLGKNVQCCFGDRTRVPYVKFTHFVAVISPI